MAEKFSLEASLKRIDEIVSKLETGDSSLEESLKLYEEGNGLINKSRSYLTKAAGELEKIERAAGVKDDE